MKSTLQLNKHLLPVLLLAIVLCGCGGKLVTESPYLTDAAGRPLTGDYLGQPLPGDEPERFAPGIVSTGMYTRDFTMTPDGNEIYYLVVVGRYNYTAVLTSKRVDGKWTRPEVAPFSADPDKSVVEPFISPDGKQLLFISDRASDGREAGDNDIWVMDRIGAGWGEPHRLEGPVNTENPEFFPSVTRDGTLYFCRADPATRIHLLYRSQLVDGRYQEPELLPDVVNCGRSQFNATISPDEDFIIVPVAGKEGGVGGVDYYICFRDGDDNWTGPVNMGDKINTPGSQEFSANLSADGKYLFFMSVRVEEREEPETYQHILATMDQPGNGGSSIYWMRSDIIDELRTQALEVSNDR
ncbi:MAG: hypothetical protein GY835_14545 [bacterium]|nr:hypothetical protein [bacterium]